MWGTCTETIELQSRTAQPSKANFPPSSNLEQPSSNSSAQPSKANKDLVDRVRQEILTKKDAGGLGGATLAWLDGVLGGDIDNVLSHELREKLKTCTGGGNPYLVRPPMDMEASPCPWVVVFAGDVSDYWGADGDWSWSNEHKKQRWSLDAMAETIGERFPGATVLVIRANKITRAIAVL